MISLAFEKYIRLCINADFIAQQESYFLAKS